MGGGPLGATQMLVWVGVMGGFYILVLWDRLENGHESAGLSLVDLCTVFQAGADGSGFGPKFV